jgi:transcriptional regulator with XRE-family HTH domain
LTPRVFDAAQAAEVRRLRAGGMGTAELARRFDVSQYTIQNYSPWEAGKHRKAGLAVAAPMLKADRDDEIRRLWGQGVTGKVLARRFGVAQSTVAGIVAGLPSRRRYGDPEDATWPLPRRVARRPDLTARRVVPASGETIGASPMSHRGSAHGRAKLDEAKVARMKRLRLDGWTTNALAREFGVGSNTVSYVLTGKTWGHVSAAPAAIGGEPC